MTSPTDKAPPLCRDCEHVRIERGDVPIAQAAPEGVYFCKLPEVSRRSVINGVRHTDNETPCTKERGPLGKCGIFGLLFKAREGA